MTLRPIAAHWFELLTAHGQLARTMECLSRTGAVELEARSGREERVVLPDVSEQLKAHQELARRYQSYWPDAIQTPRPRTEALHEILKSARNRLEAWAQEADPVIVSIERISREIIDLDQLNEALTHGAAALPDLRLLVEAGPKLTVRLVRLAAGSQVRELPALVLFRAWNAPTANYLLVVGCQADIAAVEAQLAAIMARVVPLPSWLPASADVALTAIAQRRAELVRNMRTAQEKLAALSDRFEIAIALGDIVLIEWFNQHAKDLRGSERLAWITGWTSDVGGTSLRQALDAESVRYILRLTDAPTGANAPSVLSNPTWAHGFEFFARMLGTPASNEIDPTVILAVIVPLIFGFMFGDVGQGLVVMVAGMVLGRRYPMLRVLIPGGVAAIGFGLLFGSVFCREDIIPALWLHPLRAPVTILIAAGAAGVVVLSIGLLLDAVQAHWRGEAHRWWTCRAGLSVVYLGVLLVPFWLGGVIVAAIGMAWCILGPLAIAAERRLAAVIHATGEFVEESLRLFVNTVSFTRVGAFALAHSGLSVAVVEVATAAGPIGYWIVFILGNVLVIALEGLVVSIQTTRLMLFEFFVRFLVGKGRVFSPLPPPNIRKTVLSETS
jgi:V/A-type H+-transporting ATPase subunit I